MTRLLFLSAGIGVVALAFSLAPMNLDAGDFEEDCGQCFTNECPPDEHTVEHRSIGSNIWENAHENCALNVYGEDCDNHDICYTEDEEEVESEFSVLARVAESKDPREIEKALSSLDGRYYLNSDRGQIQLLGCSGLGVTAQVPVDAGVLEALN